MKTTKQLHLLILFSAYAISLLIFRAWLTDSTSYRFLIWNLFLAYIPFLISQQMVRQRQRLTKFMFAFGTWLLFLPNAPYIITDIFHLTNRTFVPLWFDLLLIFSFAMNGMLLFFISTYQMHSILIKRFSYSIAWIISSGIMFLTGFGIYLGRFLRFNSWDVLSNPMPLFLNIVDRFTDPFAHLKTWGFTISYGLFFLIGFLLINMLISSFMKTISINKKHIQ